MAENETPEGFKRNMKTLAADLANGTLRLRCTNICEPCAFCRLAFLARQRFHVVYMATSHPFVHLLVAERNSVPETLEKAWSWVSWVDAPAGTNRSTPWHQDYLRIYASYDISRALLRRKTCVLTLGRGLRF